MTKRRSKGEHKANTLAPVADVRTPDGKFAPGYTPVGAVPWRPGADSPNPKGRPLTVLGHMKAIAKAEPALVQRVARVPYELADDITQDGATRLGATKILLDRLDGAVALKVEGLSEAQMRAWALRVAEGLKRRLPAEHHQAIAEAILEACGDEREVEAEPAAELPAAPAAG